MDSKQKGDTETFPNPYLVYHVFVYYLRVEEGGGGGERKINLNSEELR